MKIRNIVILALAALSISACSSESKRIDYKTASSRSSSLEVPPDLTTPGVNEQFVIPGEEGVLAANYSNYSKGEGAQFVKGAVLPELKNVRLERDGMKHWLVVNDKAENVWTGVKAFWLEMGFQLQVENPQAGVMETDWLENSGNAPNDFVRRVLGNGKGLDILQSAGERDQYMARLERSKDGLSTEVHITQQTMRQILGLNQTDIKWLPQENDQEIEIAMLQMLMSRLSGETNAVAIPASAAVAVVNVQLKEVTDGKVIQINEPFDKSWRKVGLALDKARIAVEDKNRAGGVFLLRAAAAAKDKKADSYQVMVRESGAVCEVSVRNADGASDKKSLRITEALYQNIEK